MRVGEKYKVYVETKEGQVMKLDTISVQMDVSLDYHGIMPTSEITLKVVGLPKWESSKEFRADKLYTENEWKCTWCGRINSRKDQVCKSCGGARSILY